METQGGGLGNDQGYGKNVGDWVIRREAPKGLMPMENPQRLGGGGVSFLKGSLKIESGPVERQPLDERPNQPGARGAIRHLSYSEERWGKPYHRDNWLVAAKRS